jgi:hypothetical protein
MPVEGSETVSDRLNARTFVIGDRTRAKLESRQSILEGAGAITVAESPFLVFKMRMKKRFLLVHGGVDQRFPAPFQRFGIWRDDPSAARHDAGAVVLEKVLQRGIRRPSAYRLR